MASASSACTPTTRTSGRSSFTATATPAASPPPPIGTNTAARSRGAWRSSSSPIVPCPAMTSSVVVRRDDRHAGLARQVGAVRRRVRVVVAHQLELGAQAAHGLHLDGGRGARHHDAAAQPESPRGRGHALRVVARRRGDDAGLALSPVERRDGVVGAAQLEREHRRLVLTLEPDVAAEALAQRRRPVERRGRRQDLGDPGVEDPPQHVVHERSVQARSGGTTSRANVRSAVQS